MKKHIMGSQKLINLFCVLFNGIPMGIPNDHQLDPASAGLLESIAQGLNIDVRHEQIHALALALVLPLEPPFTIQTPKTKHAWFVHATPVLLRGMTIHWAFYEYLYQIYSLLIIIAWSMPMQINS